MKVTRTQISEGWDLEILSPSPLGEKFFPASVPGSVHTDLILAGVLRDIRIDGNEVEQEWIGTSNFRYSTRVFKTSNQKRHEIVFYGLDTLAQVFINGKLRLQTKNMHRSYRLDVTEDFF